METTRLIVLDRGNAGGRTNLIDILEDHGVLPAVSRYEPLYRLQSWDCWETRQTDHRPRETVRTVQWSEMFRGCYAQHRQPG